MSDAAIPTSHAQARRTAETAQWMTLAAIIIILLGLAAQFGAQSLETLRAMPETPRTLFAQLNDLLRIWIWAVPPLLFVGALVELRKALREYAEGRFFSPSSTKSLRKSGEEAVYALIASVLIAPTVSAWTGGDQGGIVWKFETVDLAMLAFALAFAAVARVLDLAVAIKAENDQIV